MSILTPTTTEAVQLIRNMLEKDGRRNRLTTRMVHFRHPCRSIVFVCVHNWAPHPFAAKLERTSVESGFRVEFLGREAIKT